MTDPYNPELLVHVTNDSEAASIMTALAAEGIKATTTGGYTAGFRVAIPSPIAVLVRHEDLSRAKTILAELRDRDDIDWSQVDVGRPE